MNDQLRRSEFTMHLREIRSRLGLVALSALAAFVVVGGWRLSQSTPYEASAVIQVSVGADVADDGDITEFRTRQLAELARTAPVLEGVRADTELDIDLAELEDRLDLELLDTPGFLRITTEAATAAEAASLANAVAARLIDVDQFGALAPVDSATLVDPATAAGASAPSGPARAMRDGIVAALGVAIVVGEGLVLLRIVRGRFSPTDPTIDAASVLDAPVVDLRDPSGQDLADFVIEHVRPYGRVIILQTGPPRGNEGTIILTRTAGHLGDRVLLVDGDEGRSDLHGDLGLQAGPGMAELAAGRVDLQGAIRPGGERIGASVLTAGDPIRATHRAPTVLGRIEPYLDATEAELVLVSVTSASSPEQRAGIVQRLGYPVVLAFDPEQHRISELRDHVDRLRRLGATIVGGVLIGSMPIR